MCKIMSLSNDVIIMMYVVIFWTKLGQKALFFLFILENNADAKVLKS